MNMPANKSYLEPGIFVGERILAKGDSLQPGSMADAIFHQLVRRILVVTSAMREVASY